MPVTLGICAGIAVVATMLFVVLLDLYLKRTHAFSVGKETEHTHTHHSCIRPAAPSIARALGALHACTA